MAKVSKEEYKMLKGLDKEWRWIARDENGELYRHEEKPRKFAVEWISWRDYYLYLDNETFQFIQWEDEEPYNIAWLLGEYEEAEYGYFNNELYERFCEESEEKKVRKNIEWLVNKWTEERDETDVHDPMYQFLSEIIADVNQLDEPEVLSQREIINIVLDDLKEHIKEQQSLSQNVGMAHTPAGNDTHYRQYDYVLECINEYEPSDDLQNLLMPKQELPVIPEFVAEFLDGKEEYALYELFDGDFIYESYDKLGRWLYDNDEKTNREREFSLVLAQRCGYTVKEEPLYRARLKVITNEFVASYLRTQSSEAEDRLKALEIGSKYIHEDYRHLSEFTEDELKRLDIWDSNQWEIEEVKEYGED